MRSCTFSIIVLFLFTSICFGQTNTNLKVKSISYGQAISTGVVLNGPKATESKNKTKVDFAFEKGLKGREFILATLPDDCPEAIIEQVKKLDDNKIIIVTKELVKSLPVSEGARKTTFSNLIKLGLGTQTMAAAEVGPGECLDGPFYTAMCRCYDYILLVKEIPVNHCSDNCWPAVGIYIMCAPPCWTVYVPCTNQ